MMGRFGLFAAAAICLALPLPVPAQNAGESPALGEERITQDDIVDGGLARDEIRAAGLKIFTTLFNKLDGYGDGDMNPADPVSPGGRPTLQNNGTLLRVNGLDGQGCIECHATVSAATSPPRLGIGGVGGAVTNAVIMPTVIDPSDENLNGFAEFNGRYANPPFVFGSGAVELLAAEMTQDLQALKAHALNNPGTVVSLVSKGVDFGVIQADLGGTLDLSQIEGVDEDLVVKPFGRKGEFTTTRAFDIEAMKFHFGMQPVEVFGPGVDGDGDGVTDEVLAGELSALSIFVATLDRPYQAPPNAEAASGASRFVESGCNACHMPELQTRDRFASFRFPEVPTDPTANVYYAVDLTHPPASFPSNGLGGIRVPLFADLKRHDMGPGLAEDFAGANDRRNREFTTARLWGIADTAPYLHDGRATTLSEAILAHGGEAQEARDNFAALEDQGRVQLLAFLRTLRTPRAPASDLIDGDDDEDEDDDEDDDGIYRRGPARLRANGPASGSGVPTNPLPRRR